MRAPITQLVKKSILQYITVLLIDLTRRRRMNVTCTEENTKIVAAVRETEFIQLLAGAIAIVH